MKITHKTIETFCGTKRLEDNTAWINPDSITSIEQNYNSQISEFYAKVVDSSGKAYFVYDEKSRRRLEKHSDIYLGCAIEDSTIFDWLREDIAATFLLILIGASLFGTGVVAQSDYNLTGKAEAFISSIK